jgi:hypothetical protein
MKSARVNTSRLASPDCVRAGITIRREEYPLSTLFNDHCQLDDNAFGNQVKLDWLDKVFESTPSAQKWCNIGLGHA